MHRLDMGGGVESCEEAFCCFDGVSFVFYFNGV